MRACDGRSVRRGIVAAALAVAAGIALAAPPARAFGSYDSKLETGSAIGLLAVGGVMFIPTAIALMDPPLTTQRIVGRSLVMAGSLVAIAFGVYYFASDDPLWIPHALGWGIGGGLAITGFAVWLSDDEELAAEPPPDSGTGSSAPPANRLGSPDLDVPPGTSGPPTADRRPATADPRPPTAVLLPLVLPGGAGLSLSAAW
ncbi:MAG: hypothetical protein HY907_11980 [Deltaproteobacteria bacterium]|nr:hypothetical protein [Deltaproteobacteria bacterium]